MLLQLPYATLTHSLKIQGKLMFEYLRGQLTETSLTKAVIEAAGIGYAVLIPLSTYNRLPKIGSPIHLYTLLVVREDAHTLYGFLTSEERDLFISVCDVSGIGPKIALALIGHLDIGDLYTAISQGQVQLLCKIPGVGKKTAERLVLELRDRLKTPLFKNSLGAPSGGGNSLTTDAVSALINLGYNALQAQKAVRTIQASRQEELSLPELITAALRQI